MDERIAAKREALGGGAWVASLDAWVRLIAGPGAAEQVDPMDEAALMARLAATLPLRQETIKILGREVKTPRLTSWHGDPGASYVYSKTLFVPEPWTEELSLVRRWLFESVGVDFNGVLVNHYRDGEDAMGWHSDDEPELGPRAPDDVLIASVSLGAPRRFLMRPRRESDGLGGTRAWDLGHGNLFLMGGTTQRLWRHRLARTAKMVGPRLNLTFRMVRSR